MSAVVHPKNIFIYFDNNLNYAKVKNLHSFCIVQSVWYIATKINGHSNNYSCCCLKCLLCRLLLSILLSRGHKQLLSIVTCRNFMFVTNKCIYNSLGQRQWALCRKLLRFPKKLAGFRNYVSVLEEFIRSYSLTQLLWYWESSHVIKKNCVWSLSRLWFSKKFFYWTINLKS